MSIYTVVKQTRHYQRIKAVVYRKVQLYSSDTNDLDGHDSPRSQFPFNL